MSEPLVLPAKLDLAVAMKLVSDLRAMDGDMTIDASNVTHLGALSLQALIAASRHAKTSGHSFEIRNIHEKALDQMRVMGITPEQLMEGV